VHDEPGDGVDRGALTAAVDALVGDEAANGTTFGFVAIHRGCLVAERYGALPDTVFGPGKPVDVSTPLLSWSMAKSVTQALVGLCVADGALALDAPAPVPAWAGDARRAITLQQLLNMRSGLEFVEDYVDSGVSHVIEMLFGTGKDDVAGYAAAFPLVAPPGALWNYSSGTSNIVARIVGDAVGGGEAGLRAFMSERLFGPIGMTTADPRFDPAGTFIGSSFVYASAPDFARFGYLYLRGGTWDGQAVLPAGWADHARTPTPVPETEDYGYGAHWWLWREEPGSLAAHGYEGQRIVVLPGRDLVLVRLGRTPEEQRVAMNGALRRVVACFPRLA
jgi:CubicO group peptidase (beta-lactamase class C family)